MFGLIFLLASIGTIAHAQVIGLGACPSVTLKTNIDSKQLAGKWYESERYTGYFDTGKCVNLNLMDMGFGYLVTTSTTNPTTNVSTTLIGISAPIGAAMPGQYVLIFPTTQLPIPLPFGIVNTDYTSYAVAYTCVDLSVAHIKFLWILTRDRIATSSTSNAAYGVMDWAKLDRTILQKVDQTCP